MNSDQNKGFPTTVLATLIMAGVSSLCCFGGIVIELILNVSNPVWDTRVRVIAIIAALILLAAAVGIGIVIRKRSK